MDRQQKTQLYKGFILSSLIITCILLTILINLYLGVQSVYTQFFYVPILIAALWYHKKAVYLAVFFGILHMVINFMATGYFDPATLIRAVMFVFVGVLAGSVAGEKDLLNSKLEKSGAETSNIIAFYPDPTLVIDCDGKVIAWNHAIELMTGIKAKDMIGKGDMEYAVPFYGRSTPMLIDLLGRPVAEVMQKYPEVSYSGNKLESVITQAKIWGNDTPVLHATASKLYDRDGNLVGAIESFRDITDQKKMEVELNKKLKEVESQRDELEQQEEELARQNEELLHVFNLLKESEEKHRIIAESVNDGILAIDRDGNFTFFNRRAEDITGYSSEELIGNSLMTIVPGEYRPYMTEVIGHIYNGNIATSYEINIPGKDGRKIPLEMNLNVAHNASGESTGIIVAFRDITLRKQADELLKRYQILSQYANDIILFIGTDGRIQEANETAMLTYGYRRDELLSMNIRDLRVGDSQEVIQKQMDQADNGGLLFETIHLTKGGKRLPVEVSSRGVTIGNERVLLSIVRDISDRKRIEEVQRESDVRFQNIANSMVEAIISIDDQANIVFWNQSAERIFGYTADDMLGKSVTSIIPGNSREIFLRGMGNYVSGQNTVMLSKLVQYTGIRKDGTAFMAEMSLSSWTQNGRIMFSAIIRDITERKHAEEALENSEKKYRRLVELAQEGIWAIDASSVTTFVNPRMAEMLGYTAEEMLGKHLFTFMDERGIEIAKMNVERRKQGITEQHDFEFIKKDGTRIYTIMDTTPLNDGSGNYIGAMAAVTDITRRKKSEEALSYKNKELEIISSIASIINRSNMMEELLEGTLAGALELLGMDSGVIYLNDPSDRSLMSLRAFIPRTEEGMEVDPLKEVRADPLLNTEKVFYSTDHEMNLYEEIFEGKTACIVAPIILKGFAIGIMAFYSTETVSAGTREMSDLMSIASQLGIAIDNYNLMKTLRATSNYMAEIINESPDAIITSDSQGNIISSNKRAAHLLKYDMVELSGMNMRQLMPGSADLALASNRSYVREFLRKDGSTITLNISTSSFEASDLPGGYIITLKDLSEIIGLKIAPVAEKASDDAPKQSLEMGLIYLFDKSKGNDYMDIFVDQVKHNIQGLCITRHSPKRIREKYGLEKTPIVWLNGSELQTSEHCIKPDNLTGLGATINKFMADANEGLVLLDGVEYLIARNSFESVLKFLHLLNDRVMMSNCMVMLCMDPMTIDQRQHHLLLTEMRELGENNDY